MASLNTRCDNKKLSRSILDMKFMKRTKEKVCQEEDDAEGRAIFASEVTEAMKVGGQRFIVEPSYVPCEDLLVGRLSYNGMNPDIERLLELENQDNSNVCIKDEDMTEVDVSAQEMADQYSSLVDTMGNKFNRRDSPVRKKQKFMKPKDE